MTLRLNGSTSGYTEIDAPAVAGNNTLVLPTGNGSAGNILGTDGAGNLSWVNGRMVLATAQNTTSGTSIDFTGIPSWVKRITVILSGVSTNGASGVRVRLGSGSVQTTGYNARSTLGTTGWNSVTSTTGGFDIPVGAVSFVDGHIIFHNLAANTWIAAGLLTSDNPAILWTGGNVSLSGTLDRVRITTVNGTDTFDAGSINILYEG